MADGEAVAIYIDVPASHGAAIAQGKIHRFPRGLRGIGGSDERYIAPTVVAIGPYRHGEPPHLQDMEKAKLAAANHFFAASVEDVYGKLLSVVGKARDCYDDDDKRRRVRRHDGCFLLHYLSRGSAVASDHTILKDVMLLENQIPWLVLDTLMEMEFLNVDVRNFVAGLGDKFFPKNGDKAGRWWSVVWATGQRGNITKLKRDINGGQSYESYRPAHLLVLLRFSQIWRMPEREINYVAANTSLLSSSAVELAQIGVNLTASTAATSSGAAASYVYGDFVVSSYLSALAMLMDREEDVQQLRGHRVVLSTFSNTQTLDLFKRIGQHLSLGSRYFVVLEQIEAYRRNRPARTMVYKFLYKHIKAISVILSIVSVFVGIFKALRGR
uniref:Uncharacterized protein n=1 Tax=Oryza rufipogon TaxID=4529 RepID=A0A0E0QDR3_ORYRU